MTHLDEGQLHAYLDGEGPDGGTAERQAADRHLAECSACRARLDEERRVRDQARALLAATGPAGVSAPPFEAVLERAKRQRARPPHIPRTVALAWAASVALAVTVGWYARSLVLRGGAAGEAGAPPAATAGAPSEAAGRLGAADAAAGAADEARAGAPQAAPPASRQVAQGFAAEERPAPKAAPQPSRSEVERVAPPTRMLEDRVRADLAVAKTNIERDTGPPAVGVSAAPAPMAAPILRRQRVQPVAQPPEPVEEAWVTVTPAEAERRVGGPLATIPGLPSLGTTVFGAGPAVVARTIQVLGPGLTIELVQERARDEAKERAAMPAAAREAPGGAFAGEPGSVVTVQWEGFAVTGRALVPADSLRRLLSRLSRP